MQEEPQYSDILGNIVYNQIVLPYQTMQSMQRREKPVKENTKPKKKCLRDSCEVLTNHNGGYCSANCCKEDRK